MRQIILSSGMPIAPSSLRGARSGGILAAPIEASQQIPASRVDTPMSQYGAWGQSTAAITSVSMGIREKAQDIGGFIPLDFFLNNRAFSGLTPTTAGTKRGGTCDRL